MIPSVVWLPFPDLAVIAACAGVVAGMSALSVVASRLDRAREQRKRDSTAERRQARRAA